MNVSEITKLILSIRGSRKTLDQLLQDDADYVALSKLPSADKAVEAYDIIRGANLRAKLGRKHGADSVYRAIIKIDLAISELELARTNAIDAEMNRDLAVIDRKERITPEENFYPIAKRSTPLGKVLTRSFIALAILFAIGGSLPETAKASKNILQSIHQIGTGLQR